MTEHESLDRAVELLGEADQLLDGVAMDLEESGLRAVAIMGVEHELYEPAPRIPCSYSSTFLITHNSQPA